MKIKALYVGVLLVLAVLSGCAQQSVAEVPMSQRYNYENCPAGTAKICDVWGGNKFRKREYNCRCQ